MAGIFTISLDLEIHWGVSDHRTIESYEENLRNVPQVVRRLLQLFKEREIHATWATVGMLFCNNKAELFSLVKPEKYPSYLNRKLSNYTIAKEAGDNESDDPYHYAPSLIQQICNTPNQEMATHTFSHYYCLEPGQTPEQFSHDLDAAKQVAKNANAEFNSIVFPRNQYGTEYLRRCKEAGLRCYRGNYLSWMYRPEAKSTEGKLKRFARLTDAYLPISGARCVSTSVEEGLLNIPASCFLRPYNPKLALFEPLRLSRIKNEMNVAAKEKKIFHLWWHPHNFGKHMDKNFSILGKILDHYAQLQRKSGMQSLHMKDIYELALLSK